MRILACLLTGLCITGAMSADVARAQGRSGGTSAFGTSGFGTSGFGSSGFGSSTFGRSGFGSSGFGSGGFGSSSFGRSGFGSSGFGSTGFGTSGFGSSQYGGGQAFVGRDATDMQSTFSQTSRASERFFNNMNRQMARANRSTQQTTVTTRNPLQRMRMEVHVGFAAPQPTSDAVARTLQTRLAKILADHQMTQPQVAMRGDTAVISGTVASDGERQVIAQLVALEPGVRNVQDEMTVANEPSADTVPPPGS